MIDWDYCPILLARPVQYTLMEGGKMLDIEPHHFPMRVVRDDNIVRLLLEDGGLLPAAVFFHGGSVYDNIAAASRVFPLWLMTEDEEDDFFYEKIKGMVR